MLLQGASNTSKRKDAAIFHCYWEMAPSVPWYKRRDKSKRSTYLIQYTWTLAGRNLPWLLQQLQVIIIYEY